jgi:hypothetical protein
MSSSGSDEQFNSILLHNIVSMAISVDPGAKFEFRNKGHTLDLTVQESTLSLLLFLTNDPGSNQKLTLVKVSVLNRDHHNDFLRVPGISEILATRFMISDHKEHVDGQKYHSPFSTAIKGRTVAEVVNALSGLSEGCSSLVGVNKNYKLTFNNDDSCYFVDLIQGKCSAGW